MMGYHVTIFNGVHTTPCEAFKVKVLPTEPTTAWQTTTKTRAHTVTHYSVGDRNEEEALLEQLMCFFSPSLFVADLRDTGSPQLLLKRSCPISLETPYCNALQRGDSKSLSTRGSLRQRLRSFLTRTGLGTNTAVRGVESVIGSHSAPLLSIWPQ